MTSTPADLFASVELTMPRFLVPRLSQARRTSEPAVTAAYFLAVLFIARPLSFLRRRVPL